MSLQHSKVIRNFSSLTGVSSTSGVPKVAKMSAVLGKTADKSNFWRIIAEADAARVLQTAQSIHLFGHNSLVHATMVQLAINISIHTHTRGMTNPISINV